MPLPSCPAALLLRFSGHAIAAGCTLAGGDEHSALKTFDQALGLVAAEWRDAATLTRRLRTDGSLQVEWPNPTTVQRLDAQVWHQGFEALVFCDAVPSRWRTTRPTRAGSRIDESN